MPKKMSDISRVARDLLALGAVPTVEDNIEVTPCEYDDGVAVVGEDNERDQWVAEFTFEDRTFEDVTDVIASKFGPPSKVHPIKNGHGPVNNWSVGRATIVHAGSDVEVYQDFTRR